MSSFGMIFGIIKASSVAIAMHRQFSHSLNGHADGSDGPARIRNNRVRDDNRPRIPVYPAVADSPPDYASPRNAVADRKSTRLNSSHAKISYAVFFLKKKNRLT